ncbi:unnamed protein product [Protopolystoma xenopodis]|uniref:Uncharacterized protein n=1 Tax=Protopolystoma xenopodis TaxID=117903 RepID=A0A448WJE6_9PLAT|nr:unnamed protein product [Protopolystoma xenopodis]
MDDSSSIESLSAIPYSSSDSSCLSVEHEPSRRLDPPASPLTPVSRGLLASEPSCEALSAHGRLDSFSPLPSHRVSVLTPSGSPGSSAEAVGDTGQQRIAIRLPNEMPLGPVSWTDTECVCTCPL